MNNNMADMIQRFMQFQQTYKGDAKAEVMRMLQSGQITQAQLDQAQRTASQIQAMLTQKRM